MRKNDLEIVDELELRIKNEVNRVKQVTRGEFNLLLSGGIDSGVLAALGNPDRVFTVDLPYGPKYGELDYATSIVNHLGLQDRHTVIHLDDREFESVMPEAVHAIGRPIPHFNIFPLFVLYRKLADMGINHAVLGDGPDESMCGYTRHLIMNYMYMSGGINAFKEYGPTIRKILPDPTIAYANIIGKDYDTVYEIINKESSFINGMCKVDMELMRPDMDDMSNGLAFHFGVYNHRPYQEKDLDEFMFGLPEYLKISNIEYGKYALRKVADKYLPKKIAWRKHKVGGPVYPVNVRMQWTQFGEFDKTRYMEYQNKLLSEPL